MKIFEKLKNFSISTKLYMVFGVMAFLIGFELFILSFAMQTLSSVRSFVEGEALWSKAQKDSINYLQSYIITRDNEYYYKFKSNLKVTQGDRQARVELESKNPDIAKVYEGFIQGGIHIDDIDGMIKLLTRFSKLHYIQDAVGAWTEADKVILKLTELAMQINEQNINGTLNKKETAHAIEKLNRLNQELTRLETEFSSTLGAGSRFLEKILLVFLLCLVMTVEVTGLFFTFTFGKRLSTALSKFIQVTKKIGEGDFNQKVEVRSNDELGVLAIAINNMSEDLKRNIAKRKDAEHRNQTKSLFLANMSHEIRNPLSLIMGFSEALEVEGLDNTEKEKFLSCIKKATEDLNEIISDILDISKVESGKLNIKPERFNLVLMFKDIEELFKLRFEKKGLFLRIHFIATTIDNIFTDQLRLKQILLNLISNSLKFTDEGGVDIYINIKNENLVIDIKDTGVGIADSDKESVFDIFEQSEIDHSKNSGVGLGLPLSKNLANLLGGDITLISSEQNKGSHFQVIIKKSLEQIGASLLTDTKIN